MKFRRKWLLLDSNYLCWRAFHALKNQQFTDAKGVATEMLYGFMRDIVFFQDVHNTQRIVFCFDHKPLLRHNIYPDYKKGRTSLEEDKHNGEYEKLQVMRRQILKLRDNILTDIGFKNVFHQKGYEADDVIASLCKSLKQDEEAIIIASDADLWQLLSPQVCIWNPRTREAITHESFKKTHGIPAKKWIKVKAIAGCNSDKIPGIKGVGEMTALRYLRREIPKSSKAYQSILAGSEIIKRNIKLVELPFEGTPTFTMRDDRGCRERWSAVMNRFDMASLEGKM
jgi:DNA polymerase-1